MGYTTDFEGRFKLNKPLDDETFTFLQKLATTRRMKRNLGSEYGVEGEFYVDGSGDYGQGDESNIVNYNSPPRTQPSLWCQWVPSEDRLHIEWDGNEKFYSYVEWLQYIITKVLKPKGYSLSGEVEWMGEDSNDRGMIVVVDNEVKTKRAKITFVDEE